MKLRTFIRELFSREARLERLRKELAEVEMAIRTHEEDEFFKMSAENQKTYIETAERSATRAWVALREAKDSASVRLGIKDEEGHWTERFKKAVEFNIGATEEEMDAAYASSKFHRVLDNIAQDLVDRDQAIIAAKRAAERAQAELYAAEEKMQSMQDGTKKLENHRRELKSDIEFILYLKMERKKARVHKNIDDLYNGKRRFDWKSKTDEELERLYDRN